MLDGILWILHTGAPWRDLPERFGPWSSVYNTFLRWQSTGRIDAILEACNSISMKKGLSTSTCGALMAPMSGHPKMLPNRVKILQLIKRLAAHMAVLAAKFTWSLMVMVCRWGSVFRPGNQRKSDMRQVRWPWQGYRPHQAVIAHGQRILPQIKPIAAGLCGQNSGAEE